MPTRAALAAALHPHGLHVRGGFCPQPEDGLYLADGSPAAVLWLVGNVGGSLWEAFSASACARDGLPHPLDRWSRQVGDALAQQWGARALYPFSGPPEQPAYHPFQQWAARCEAVYASPLMLRIHPQHGLWHAYRFALIFSQIDAADQAHLQAQHDQRQAQNATQHQHSPCLHCVEQPCLTRCPAAAFDGRSFGVAACASHLRTPAGQRCMQGGCLARNACPVAADLRYPEAQSAFHMAAFLRARG